MVFAWDDQSMRWFLAASAYTGFHRELARRIAPHLAATDTLCDFGCGLGRLDLELAPSVSRLTALDINARTLEIVRGDARTRGLCNIETVCADARETRDTYDVGLMSFFGRGDLDFFLSRCRRLLIRVVNADNDGNLYPTRHRKRIKTTIADARAELAQRGLVYRLDACAIEFGQPLVSPRDGAAFVRHHAPDASQGEIEDFLAANVVRTGHAQYPYYLPNNKRIGIFTVFLQG